LSTFPNGKSGLESDEHVALPERRAAAKTHHQPTNHHHRLLI